MIWDKLYLENKIHRTCCSGDDGIKDNFWHGPTHFSCLISCHIPDSFLPFTTLDVSQALHVVFTPLSFQPQGLCTCCFLCLDCSSLPSQLVNSYHPSDLSPLSQRSHPWPFWTLNRLKSPHIPCTSSVRACVHACVWFSFILLPELLGDRDSVHVTWYSISHKLHRASTQQTFNEWMNPQVSVSIYLRLKVG